MWVPLVENGEWESAGADYFVQESIKKLFAQCARLIRCFSVYPLSLADKKNSSVFA
jgi:hypothetical protein